MNFGSGPCGLCFSASAQMVPAVILNNVIVSIAKEWREQSLNDWGKWSDPRRHLVSKAEIVSPVDGLGRKVAFFLSTQLPAAAFTCLPDAKDNFGDSIAPAGHFSIHVSRNESIPPRKLLAALLHEITHTVDPQFVSDTLSKQNWPNRWKADARRHYGLASEQRAFTAMWIEEIRVYLGSSQKPAIDEFLTEIMAISTEFTAFFNTCPHLHKQIRDHFNVMARQFIPSSPTVHVPPGMQ